MITEALIFCVAIILIIANAYLQFKFIKYLTYKLK